MSDAPKTFEERLERVERIVKELESGTVDLDRAILLFKEGKALVRECETLLKGYQETIDRAMAEASPTQ